MSLILPVLETRYCLMKIIESPPLTACQMIYASTRNSVTKSLGAANFVDTIFATSKEDLTPEGYAAHKRHLAAPKPMSAREKEMAGIKAAEREAGSTPYNVKAARQSPFGTGLGLKWSSDAEAAVRNLANATEDQLITMVNSRLSL
jgi:twinfilin-like protein